MAVSDLHIPVLVKHTTLAIFHEGKLTGSASSKFQSAFAIARSRLVEYGFLQPSSRDGDVGSIRLAHRGVLRESRHKAERDSRRKCLEFDTLFEKYIQPPDPTKRDES